MQSLFCYNNTDIRPIERKYIPMERLLIYCCIRKTKSKLQLRAGKLNFSTSMILLKYKKRKAEVKLPTCPALTPGWRRRRWWFGNITRFTSCIRGGGRDRDMSQVTVAMITRRMIGVWTYPCPKQNDPGEHLFKI